MSKGGFVAFRGSSAVAESYLASKEQDRDASAAAAYLSEDKPFQHGAITADGAEVDALTREEFRAWAEHADPETGEIRGAFRTKITRSVDKDGNLVEKVGGTPLYQETLISSSKSLSLAAAANPDIAQALESAMERATVRMAEAFHEHAVTRVGARGKQQQVKFDQIEFTAVQHHTSRSGDPHEHRHVQFLSSGLVTLPNGKQAWRAPDGAVLYRMAERLHAAADLTIATDVELRQSIADAGFTWVPGEGGGKVKEFEALTDEFSMRRDEVDARRETLEVQWRAEHPGQEPGKKQLQAWKHYAWASTRPDKKELEAEAQEDQADRLATAVPTNDEHLVKSEAAAKINAKLVASDALADLALQHSAWSRADVKAAIDRRLAETYVMGDDGLAELQAAALEVAEKNLVNFYDDGVDIEGTQHYTSKAVLATDKAIETSLKRRAQSQGTDGYVKVDRGGFDLTEGQAAAARAITGSHQLVVTEGAAGTGKTTMLSAANEEIIAQGRRLVAVSPTKRGAIEMAKEIGAQGNSVHSMLVRAGAEFDDRGRWFLPKEWAEQPDGLTMDKNTVLVVDEVGMLDMGTAEVLHKYCDDTGVQLVLLGDRKQLAAVGRGGYLPKAVHLATNAHDLRDVQRFKTADKQIDQQYADATLELRDRKDPEAFFDLLHQRGQVQTGEPEEVLERVAETVALEINADRSSVAIASTNATAQRINHKVYERLIDDGVIDARITAEGRDGDPIAVGAKVATRQNDREMQVANRQTWIVKKVNRDGRVIVADEETKFHTTLDAQYVRENLQLAYAVTAHGSQGMTVDTAHFVLSDQADAAAAYVGLTRGRYANVLHAVAADMDDAKIQFQAAIGRQGADQGLDDARVQAQQTLQGLDTATAAEEQGPSQLQIEQQARLDLMLARQAEQLEASKQLSLDTWADALADQQQRRSSLDEEMAQAAAVRRAILDNPPAKFAGLTGDELAASMHQQVIVTLDRSDIFNPSRFDDRPAMREQHGLTSDEAEYLAEAWWAAGRPGTQSEEDAEQRAEQERQRELAKQRVARDAITAEDTAARAVDQQLVDVPEAPAQGTEVTAEAPADAVDEHPFRSGLRDLERKSPAMQKRLTGLAEVQEQWHGRMPRTDEERRAFEREVAAVGVGRTTLQSSGVQQSMDPKFHGVLMQRVEQAEHGNASGERAKDLTREIAELKEFQRTRDTFGVHGTTKKIDAAETDLRFERGYIDRLKTDREAGIYDSREHERDEHQAAVASQRTAANRPTATQKQVAAARKTLARDKARVDEREQTRDQDDSLSMG